MNSQFDFFVLTEFLFGFNNTKLICMPYFSLCSFISVCIFSATPPPYQNQYSPATNIIDYLDPGTMPQQNSTIIVSTTVLETVSSSLFTNHLFILGQTNPNLSNTILPSFPNSPFLIFPAAEKLKPF